MPIENMPLSQVEWVPRESLRANTYNPNRVYTPEMRLLRQSIIEDGWTQPIVARPDGEIIDGFHRWTVAADPDVAALTGGLIPVVRLRHNFTAAEQQMSTVRHNRARGTHAILPMAEIVRSLIDGHGYTADDLAVRLGMDDEEVDRLYDRSGMPARVGQEGFNDGWVPD